MTSADQEEVLFILSGIQHAREQLIAGRFTMQGSRTVHQGNSEEGEPLHYSGSAHGLYAFDFPKERLRYDHSLPVAIGYVSSVDLLDDADDPAGIAPEAYHVETNTLNSVQQEAYHAWFNRGDNSRTSVSIFPQNYEGLRSPERDYFKFDVRALGLLDYLQFHGDPDVRKLDDVIGALRAATPLRIKRGEGLTELQFHQPETDFTINLKIDVDRGMTPTSCVTTDPYGTVMESTTQWELRSDVWVPVSFSVGCLNWPEEDDIERFEYDLDWSHVNSDLPSNIFDFRDFPAVVDGVSAVDQRSGDPKLIGIWKDGQMQDAIDLVPGTARVPKRSLKMWFWINAIIVLVFLIWMAYWRHGRDAKS